MEILNIKIRTKKYLIDIIKEKAITLGYDIDKDIIDLTSENIDLVLSQEQAINLGNIIGNLIIELSIIKSKTQSIKN